MKKSYGGVLTTYFLMLTILGYFVIKTPIHESYFNKPLALSGTYPLESTNAGIPPAPPNPANTSHIISAEATVYELFTQANLTKEEESSLQTWNRFMHLPTNASALPNAVEAMKEATTAWKSLMTSVEEEKVKNNRSLPMRETEKQCPCNFISKVNASEMLDSNGFMLPVPCGLARGSSITFIAIPNGNFQVDLIGEQLPGELYPPIILNYNVQIIRGNSITEDPVIV